MLYFQAWCDRQSLVEYERRCKLCMQKWNTDTFVELSLWKAIRLTNLHAPNKPIEWSCYFLQKIRPQQTWVSPRVKRAFPCALGSNPHCELIKRISNGFRPSLLFPPWTITTENKYKKLPCLHHISFRLENLHKQDTLKFMNNRTMQLHITKQWKYS